MRAPAKLRLVLTSALALAALALVPAPASAAFGLLPGAAGFKVEATAEGGSAPDSLAGSHPYSLVTELHLEQAGGYSEGDLQNLHLDLPAGLLENPIAVPRCSDARFGEARNSDFETSLSGENCPGDTQIGIVTLEGSFGGGETRSFGVFNLEPPVGAPSRIGFAPWRVPVTITPHIREAGGEYGITLDLQNFSQQVDVTGMRLQLWGVPWAISHNAQRGECLNETEPGFGHGKCGVIAEKPSFATRSYLTLPTTCSGPLSFHLAVSAWQGAGSAEATSAAGPALDGCDSLVAEPPLATAQLTTERTDTPTGFGFRLDGNSSALINPALRAHPQVRRATVTLAEGMTINPSVAAGLGTCSEAQFAAETIDSAPGAGCPNDSKVGKLNLDSPLVEGTVEGSMFFATPYENRFGSLVVLYLVAKAPEQGVMVKLAGKVTPDPGTGRLTAVFDDLPQLPYSHFDVQFRAGQRSPLASPPACGEFLTGIDTSYWGAESTTLHQVSPFSLSSGIGGGACPQGAAPFTPGAAGGTINSNASAYTPFYLHLTRTDVEQEITSYSARLPQGVLGRLAGIPFCPEAAIAAARRQSGAEAAVAPACPEASRVGHTYTGFGLGSSLAYAPGGLFLAGPYHGAPLSIVAIDSAKVGPFDLGTVVIRSAIDIDRRTSQVSIDSAGSDPIPHILGGVPLRLRDIRVYLDRPGFMVNPTSCNPFSVVSTLTGAGIRFSDPSDDSTATASSPFQVTNCSALSFSPRFKLALGGGHKRGEYPSLTATVAPRIGDANIGGAVVTLPRKIFLAQEHLKTVCTEKQFAAHACPKDSIYGTATAITPLLGTPMTGPVYLRSNGNQRPLPDLVAALSGEGIEIDVLGKIDSHEGGIRTTFDVVPDAPVTKFTLKLNGGKHGILANATNTCANPQVAQARFSGQDGTVAESKVPMVAKCGGKPKKQGKKGARR